MGAFGCLRRNRLCRPEPLRIEQNGLLAFPVLVPACHRPELPYRSRVRSGAWVGYLRFRSVWYGFWCLRKSFADAYHPAIAISVVSGPRDNSGCLDARHLALPCGLYRVGTVTPRPHKHRCPTPSQTDPSSRHLQDH